MTVHFRQLGQAIIVFGNTFPVKDQIKALGGRFNGTEKTWRAPFTDEALASIAGLCAALGGGNLGGGDGLLHLGVDTALTIKTNPMPSPKPSRTAIVTAPTTATSLFTEGDESGPQPATLATQVPGGPPAGLTIRQLMDHVGAVVAAAFPTSIWIVGEVQNVAKRASGVFFDLAEGQTGKGAGHQSGTLTARAIVWSGALAAIRKNRGDDRITEIMQDGMQVRVLCQVQLYRDRGQISLLIEDIDPAYTRGALALAREKLLRELRQKGLDQANKKLVLTPFPFRVGLISAEGSRAASDFLDQLQSLRFPGEVVFCAAPMQGEAVPARVTAALNALVRAGCDVVVITRGGGSAADLRWFDAPEIAYAIALCPLPVVAAIGHHDDVAVAEEICYMRQKTPTAAADFIASWFVQTRERVDRMATTVAQLLQRRIDEFSRVQAALGERLGAAGRQSLDARRTRLEQRGNRLHTAALERVHQIASRLVGQTLPGVMRAAEKALGAGREHLARLESQLAKRDPKPWLAQGWTRLFKVQGDQVARACHAGVGDVLSARLLDGRMILEVKSTDIFTRDNEA